MNTKSRLGNPTRFTQVPNCIVSTSLKIQVMLGHERHHRVHETIDAFGTLAKFVSGSNGTEAEDRGLDTAFKDYGALHPPLYPPTIPEYYDYGAQVNGTDSVAYFSGVPTGVPRGGQCLL